MPKKSKYPTNQIVPVIQRRFRVGGCHFGSPSVCQGRVRRLDGDASDGGFARSDPGGVCEACAFMSDLFFDRELDG